MNSNEPERDSIAAQWLRAWLVLVLPTFLLGLLFFGLSQSTQAKPTKQQGENLVLNPGFELPDPAFWYNSGSHQWKWEYFWSDSTFHGGSHSAGMLSNVEKRFEGWWWSAPFVVEAGRQYSFSGWIRASELSGNALLTLAFYSSESLGDQIQEFSS